MEISYSCSKIFKTFDVKQKQTDTDSLFRNRSTDKQSSQMNLQVLWKILTGQKEPD